MAHDVIIPGRAHTPEQKRAVIERIYAAWLRCPDMRFGQLIVNASADSFYDEDDTVVDLIERFASRHGSGS